MVQYSNAAASAAIDAVAALLDDGHLHIYAGQMPASADVPVADQLLLSEHRFGNPAFAPAVNGMATSTMITSAQALRDGYAAWFRTYQEDGVTVVFDGTVGTEGANLIFNTVNFQYNGIVDVPTLTLVTRKE